MDLLELQTLLTELHSRHQTIRGREVFKIGLDLGCGEDGLQGVICAHLAPETEYDPSERLTVDEFSVIVHEFKSTEGLEDILYGRVEPHWQYIDEVRRE